MTPPPDSQPPAPPPANGSLPRGGSYLGMAWGRDENRIAAAVTVVVVLAVLAWTATPASAPISVDFRDLQPRSDHTITLSGFIRAPQKGWRLLGEHGEVVFHRRLPARFELEVETLRTDIEAPTGAPATLVVSHGGATRALRFDRRDTTAHATFDRASDPPADTRGPASRTLAFDVPPGAGLQLVAVRVTPLEETGAPR